MVSFNFNNVNGASEVSPLELNRPQSNNIRKQIYNVDIGHNNRVEKIVEHKDGSKTKTILRGDQIQQITEYGTDGKIKSVKTFSQFEINGKIKSIETTHIDTDGDGYSDTWERKTTSVDYRTGAETTTIEKQKEEPIDKVLSRDHFPWEIYNRKMENLDCGMLIN